MNLKQSLYRLKQRLYHGGRPNWVATVLNRGSAAVYALGIAPDYLVALEVQRPHLPVHKDAPLSEFDQVAARFQVFHVVPV